MLLQPCEKLLTWIDLSPMLFFKPCLMHFISLVEYYIVFFHNQVAASEYREGSNMFV